MGLGKRQPFPLTATSPAEAELVCDPGPRTLGRHRATAHGAPDDVRSHEPTFSHGPDSARDKDQRKLKPETHFFWSGSYVSEILP